MVFIGFMPNIFWITFKYLQIKICSWRNKNYEKKKMKWNKNDYARNKNLQDSIAVFKRSDVKVQKKHMKELAFIVYTLIPESTKFVQRNKIEIFSGPLTLPLGPWFSFYVRVWFYYTEK